MGLPRAGWAATLLATLCCLTAPGCAAVGDQEPVVHEGWPLTVDEIKLQCDSAGWFPRVKRVTFEAAGTTYALNAEAGSVAAELGWADLAEVWADDPDKPGAKADVSSLIEEGLTRCW